ARQLIRELITAADGGLVLSPQRRRPGKTEGRAKVISIARPDALVWMIRVLPDQDSFRQRAFLWAAAGHPAADAAARVAVKRVIASFQTWRETGARCAHQVRNAEEVIPHAEVQREVGRNPPVILSEEADFVLVPVADPSKNLRVLRMEICVAKIEE